MIQFQNYHCHKEYTNVRISDSVATLREYAERVRKLGHQVLSSCEHGWQGNYYQTVKIAKEFGLKPLISAEAYWVKDRTEKDRSNCHIFIGAMNENGRRALNDVLSEANITGFYGQPRLDIPLILSLPKDDVIVTTACIAYWRYDDIEEITEQFHQHFGKNFFLEVQYHNTPSQCDLNRYIVDLHRKYNIPLIMGCDSHYLYPEQGQTRTDFLASKGLKYENEEGWYLDYPNGDEAYKRFAAQCVLTHDEIMEAMENTNVFLKVEPYDEHIFDSSIKMPSLYPELSQEEKNKKYEDLIWNAWGTYKQNVKEEDWEKYEEAISKEIKTVKDTGMADYFLDNYEIIRKGKENGGWLTKSGRGSAVSFITNMLLGFTEVDRVSAKVHMYPERFMSTTRILQSKSIPDIDFNCAPVEPFARAQKEVLGEDHAYPMIAYGTMQKSAAWKLYAKSQGISFEIANAVSAQIRKYEMAVNKASEEDKGSIDIFDYIDEEFKEVYLKSRDYLGIVTSWSIAPCSYLLYPGSIRKEIGLVRVKDNLCCIMDGHWAEECHFLKNDLLKVSVVDLIYRAYKRIGREPPSVSELLEMCPPDDIAWNIYKTGCTLGINQCEQTGTSARVANYNPRNISELAAFVAAIRPGFKSMYKTFESRKPFSYRVKAFDDLIQTDEMPNSFLLYQEQEMAALNYAGIDMGDCYTAIKNIAKKRVDKVLAYKEKFISGFRKAIIEQEGRTPEEAEKLAQDLWQIIEDSSRYSFNACLSGDTVIQPSAGGYNRPTIEEMFLTMNSHEYAKLKNKLPLRSKYRRKGYGKSLSMFDDDSLHLNNILDITASGVKPVYLVETEDGRTVKCTMTHKIPTPKGVKELAFLNVGDEVFVTGKYEVNREKYPFTSGEGQSNVPKKGIPVNRSKIKAITYCGDEMTYNVEMADPAHNLTVNNGFIVSNSHSYCVALDSLYCAWLKAHHPLEFYEVLLTIYEEKGDKDKMKAAKEEAAKYFRIKFPQFKFREDNRKTRAHSESNSITNPITAIKGFNARCGEVLWECGQKRFSYFYEVLRFLYSKGIKDAKIVPLICIDYFSEFGNIPTLNAIYQTFLLFKEGKAKIFKGSSITDPVLKEILMEKCPYTTHKKEVTTFRVEGLMVPVLRAYEEYMTLHPKPDISTRTKIDYSIDILGYVDVATRKPSDRKRLVILEIYPLNNASTGQPWGYKLITRSIGTGKEASLTVRAELYKTCPLSAGDIIKNPEVWKNPAGYWYLFSYTREGEFDS